MTGDLGDMGDMGDLDPDLLAAEYVLGVLTADEAAQCVVRVRAEPGFAMLVAAWERRLMPMAALAPAAAPPPDLLERIERAIAATPTAATPIATPSSVGPAATVLGPNVQPGIRPWDPALIAPRPAAPGLRRQLWVWRGMTGVSLAAACVMGFLLWSRLPQQEVAMLLPTGNSVGAFAVLRDHGGFQLQPVRPASVPADRDLQLWVLPANATVPRSLGVLPSAGTVLPPGAVPDGDSQLLVSVEPPGGSPTGLPTGPVVLGTRIAPAR